MMNAYWVLPGQLLAGAYPGAIEADVARERLRWLLDQGISLCLDLTEGGEGGLPPYADLWQMVAREAGRRVQHQRFSIPDFSVPSVEQMQRILNALDGALANQQAVYLHCWGGIGRTGTVVGCYLVRCGMEGEAALQQIARLRQGTPSSERQSPETEEQRRFILSWRIGQ